MFGVECSDRFTCREQEKCLLNRGVPLIEVIIKIIIQHIDTLPKYGKKTLDVRRST